MCQAKPSLRQKILLAGLGIGMIGWFTGCQDTHFNTSDASNLFGAHFDSLKPVTNVPSPTDSIRKKYYASWPKSIQDAVDHQGLMVGMDKFQVQVALGILESKITKEASTNATGRTETWYVWHNPGWWNSVKPGDFELAIIFQDDKVSAFHRLK